MRDKSKFKVRKKEHSSSVIQTQCFISHSRCVDYLFNWILVWDWKRQRPIVVAAERGWRSKKRTGNEQRKGGELQSYMLLGTQTQSPQEECVNPTGTLLYRPKHIQVYKHEQRASGSSACPIKSQYRILAVSVCQLVRMCICPILSTRVKLCCT